MENFNFFHLLLSSHLSKTDGCLLVPHLRCCLPGIPSCTLLTSPVLSSLSAAEWVMYLGWNQKSCAQAALSWKPAVLFQKWGYSCRAKSLLCRINDFPFHYKHHCLGHEVWRVEEAMNSSVSLLSAHRLQNQEPQNPSLLLCTCQGSCVSS